MFSRRKPWPLFLAAILGLSQLVWYGFFGKLWVELGYMLCLFMAIGLFLGYLLTLVVRVLARGGLLGRAGASAAVAIALLLLVGGRWWNPASAALNYRLIDSKTVVEVGKWAEAGNIPRDARVLWDDTAYFDPTKYPNARMRGDLLTYNELYAWRPDYIVLSSSIYEAKHYAELRKTQHYTMQNEGPFSVRLYQDLLSTSAPGWTKVPGIEFVRSFSENRDRKDDCSAPESGRYSPWLGDAAPAIAGEKITSIFGTAPLARWLSSRVATEIELLNHAGRLVDAIRGKVCVSSGSTLLVYRVHPPGTPNGFSRPLASSAAPDHPALAAFDGEKTTFWRPLREQRLGSFVGFDFGGGGERAVSRVQIDWPGMALAASEVTIEFADAEGEWRSAGQFPVKLARGAGEIVSSQHQLPADLGRHRLWRVVLSKIIGARQVAVAEARFLTPEEVASGTAKDIQGTIAPAVTLLDRAMQGEELVLSFDPSTCQKRDLGTIQCGSEYRARYEPQSNRWTVTGYNKGEEGIVTRSADNADALPGNISVWGMLNAFDADGKLLHAGERVGSIRLASTQSESVTGNSREVASDRTSDLQATFVPVVTLLDKAMEGEELVLSFDPSTCQKRDLGTIQCGSEYRARYEPEKNRWTVTGYNKGEQGIVTRSADNSDALPGNISVWGMLNTFDADGKLFYLGQRAGSIRLANMPNERTSGQTAEGR